MQHWSSPPQVSFPSLDSSNPSCTVAPLTFICDDVQQDNQPITDNVLKLIYTESYWYSYRTGCLWMLARAHKPIIVPPFVRSAHTPWHHCNNTHPKSMYCILTVHNRYTQYRGVILVPDLARQQILIRSPWLVWFNPLWKTAHIFPGMPQSYSPHISWTEKAALVLTKDALWFCTLLQKCVLPSLPLMHWNALDWRKHGWREFPLYSLHQSVHSF